LLEHANRALFQARIWVNSPRALSEDCDKED